MYKLNLYPEHARNRKEGKQRLIRTTIATAMAGFMLMIMGSLVLSTILVGSRIVSMRSEIRHQSAQFSSKSEQFSALKSAREMLDIRSKRVDWAPKLAALSDLISHDLILVEFEGYSPTEKREASLEMWGEARREGVQIGVLTRFAEALSADPRFHGEFPDLRLGSVQDARKTRFQLLAGNEEGQ